MVNTKLFPKNHALVFMNPVKKYRLFFTLIFLLSSLIFCKAQTIHLSNTGIYDFLDELAGEQVIEHSSLVKPWSREYIAEKLFAADSLREELTTRQKSELDFYLRDYGKELSETSNFQLPTSNLEPGT